jgi:hypothetical protein
MNFFYKSNNNVRILQEIIGLICINSKKTMNLYHYAKTTEIKFHFLEFEFYWP